MNRPTSVAYQLCDSHYSCRLQRSPRDAYRGCFSSSVPGRQHQKITADVFRGAPVSALRHHQRKKKGHQQVPFHISGVEEWGLPTSVR